MPGNWRALHRAHVERMLGIAEGVRRAIDQALEPHDIRRFCWRPRYRWEARCPRHRRKPA